MKKQLTTTLNTVFVISGSLTFVSCQRGDLCRHTLRRARLVRVNHVFYARLLTLSLKLQLSFSGTLNVSLVPSFGHFSFPMTFVFTHTSELSRDLNKRLSVWSGTKWPSSWGSLVLNINSNRIYLLTQWSTKWWTVPHPCLWMTELFKNAPFIPNHNAHLFLNEPVHLWIVPNRCFWAFLNVASVPYLLGCAAGIRFKISKYLGETIVFLLYIR